MWQRGWNAIVHLFAKTPLFRPVLYLVLAIVALVLARRQRLLRNLVISGLVYELALFILAPTNDYRLSHWLVVTSVIAFSSWWIRSSSARRIASSRVTCVS